MQSARNPKVLGYWGKDAPRVVGVDANWEFPLRADRQAAQAGGRRRMFTLSLGDFFEQFEGELWDTQGRRLYVAPSGKWVTREGGSPVDSVGFRPLDLDDCRLRALALLPLTPNIDWLILTKRANWILPTLSRLANDSVPSPGRDVARAWLNDEPPPNAWVGTSVENQQQAWLRIDELRRVPAACRFLSAEPLLGELDLTPWLDATVQRDRGFGYFHHDPGCDRRCSYTCRSSPANLPPGPDAFHWVIVGGESGNAGVSSARPCNLAWVRKVVRQCRDAGVPVFVKQMGSDPVRSLDMSDHPPDVLSPNIRINDNRNLAELKLISPKGDDIAEFPADLQVQELPHVEE